MLPGCARAGGLLLITCACVSDHRLERARTTCDVGSPTTAWAPWTVDGTPVRTISKSCAEALGESVGLDWSSFGSEPHEMFAPTEPVDVIISGLYVVLVGEMGTLGSVLEQADDHALLRVEASDSDPSMSARDFWFTYLNENISTLRYVGADGCVMAYQQYNLVGVCDIFDPEDESVHRTMLSPIGMASTLLHEAAHVTGRDHASTDSCPTFDPDPSGVYGLQAHWVSGWKDHFSDIVAEEEIEWAQRMSDFTCSRIQDANGFVPCEGARASFCEAGSSLGSF